MSDGDFDAFRDLLDGRLDPASAARLRDRIAGDAALAAEFEDFSLVHGATATDAGGVPPSSVTFARIDAARRRDRVRRLAPWMAAAAVLVGAGSVVAFKATRGTVAPSDAPDVAQAGASPEIRPAPTPASVPAAPRCVALHAIALADAAAAVDDKPLPEAPALLDDFRPVEAGRVRWIASIDDAYAMAKWTGRPVLLWIYHPQCPICTDLGKRGFADADVLRDAERFVPLRIDVTSGPKELAPLLAKGWPYLGVFTPERGAVAEFPGGHEPKDLDGRLGGAWTSYCGRAAAPVAWETANDLSAKLAQGADALKARRVAEAWRAFDDVAKRGGCSPFADAAREGVRRVAALAAAALDDAKKRCAADEKAGARSLSEAAERFRGTPFGTDLAEVEQELRATGRFPAVVEDKR